MKLVTAIIKPFKQDEVKEALKAVGVGGLTYTEVQGFGRQAGHSEVFRGAEYTVELVPKVKVEVLIEDGQEEVVAAAIADGARTGKIGDGKIWVTAVEGVVRIRTGEMGSEAI
jgi:nitrogen regulatory protein P-II 1